MTNPPPYPAEPTAAGPPPALRLAGSPQVHATSVLPIAGRDLVFPACGMSVTRRVRRIAVHDPAAVDCPSCQRITRERPTR